MGRILKNWRIIAATFFSAVLVAGSYVLARGFESPSAAQASTETALLQAIASKDSDSDGLTDWEEALYGTDPHSADTFHHGMTDGEAVAKGLIVPKAVADVTTATATTSTTSVGVDYTAAGLTAPKEGTVTDAFAKVFFARYLAAKGANGGNALTSDETATVANETLSQLSQNFTPSTDFKTADEIKVSGTGAEALRSFAIEAEAALKKNANDATMSEIEYLQAYAENNDASALTHLATLGKVYRDAATGLAAIPAPASLAADHLLVVNGIMRLGQIDDDFSRVDTDPLAAMLALVQYGQTELSVEQAFTDIAKTYAAQGVVLSAGTPGASFVNIMSDIGARQRAGTKAP